MSKAIRDAARAATATSHTQSYGSDFAPKGRASRGFRDIMQTSANSQDLRLARRRSHIATSRLVAKLSKVDVILDDSSGLWLHVIGGAIVASFASVGDAVAAL